MQLKDFELSVNQESVSFQTKKDLINTWLAISRSYFKNNGFEVTDIKLLNNDKCQQFKAQQNHGTENYVLNFYTTGRVVIQTKSNRNELLEIRIPALENLFEKNFKIKQGTPKAVTNNNTTKDNGTNQCVSDDIKNKEKENMALEENNSESNKVSERDRAIDVENNTVIEARSVSEKEVDLTNVNNISNVTSTNESSTETTEQQPEVNNKTQTLNNNNETNYQPRQIITIQPKQQKEFNDKIEAEQTRITEEFTKLNNIVNSSHQTLRDEINHTRTLQNENLVTSIIDKVKNELRNEFKKEHELLKADMQSLVNDIYRKYNAKIEQLEKEINLAKQENANLREHIVNRNGQIDNDAVNDNVKIQESISTITEQQQEHQVKIKLDLEKLEKELKIHQEKVTEHLQTEKNIEKSLTELWNIVQSPDTEIREWFTVGKNGKVLKENQHKNKDDHINLVIFGDSIVKYIKAHKIAKSEEEKSINYAHSGARIRDIYDQIKKFKTDHPSAVANNVILHVGTNHLSRDEPKDLIAKLSKVLQYLRNLLPNTNIFFSGILPKIGNFLADKIDSINRAVFSFCLQRRNFHFIQHTMFATKDGGVVEELFRNDRVHTNGRGLRQLARNFINAVRYNIF